MHFAIVRRFLCWIPTFMPTHDRSRSITKLFWAKHLSLLRAVRSNRQSTLNRCARRDDLVSMTPCDPSALGARCFTCVCPGSVLHEDCGVAQLFELKLQVRCELCSSDAWEVECYAITHKLQLAVADVMGSTAVPLSCESSPSSAISDPPPDALCPIVVICTRYHKAEVDKVRVRNSGRSLVQLGTVA